MQNLYKAYLKLQTGKPPKQKKITIKEFEERLKLWGGKKIEKLINSKVQSKLPKEKKLTKKEIKDIVKLWTGRNL